MKKILLTLAVAVFATLAASAQKFAMVDMQYVLKNIPAYEMANEQLNQLSQRWQKEVENAQLEANNLYKNYQADMVFLTDQQKKDRESAIVAQERAAVDLRNKYFGPDGELSKKRQTLLKPIQDDIYEAVKKLCEERGYQAIFDRSSSADIIFASPRIDVSNELLERLGYSQR